MTYRKWESKAPGFVAKIGVARNTDFHSMCKYFCGHSYSLLVMFMQKCYLKHKFNLSPFLPTQQSDPVTASNTFSNTRHRSFPNKRTVSTYCRLQQIVQ